MVLCLFQLFSSLPPTPHPRQLLPGSPSLDHRFIVLFILLCLVNFPWLDFPQIQHHVSVRFQLKEVSITTVKISKKNRLSTSAPSPTVKFLLHLRPALKSRTAAPAELPEPGYALNNLNIDNKLTFALQNQTLPHSLIQAFFSLTVQLWYICKLKKPKINRENFQTIFAKCHTLDTIPYENRQK